MARLESIRYTPHRAIVSGGRVEWAPVGNGKVIQALPHILWGNGMPWREANLWALENATSRDVDIKTVQANMTSIHAYAKWLEQTHTEWWTFPPKKADRCLVRYRGALIEARDGGEIAPSTASQRMRVVIRFYRWLRATGLVSPEWPMWRERIIGLHLTDSVGFDRTLMVTTTDLSIRNRAAPGERLEDGLLPIAAIHRDELLKFAQQHASIELFHILTLGFFTGMRLQTLTDLKIQSLERAVPDPSAQGLYRIAVGPGASPPVATKFGVTGHIWIAKAHHDALREYFYSKRRLQRQALASPEYRDLVFLTRFGNPYAQRGSDKSVAVNTEMHALKKRALADGLAFMRGFRFHQSRCTFATELARLIISAGGAKNAVAIVKDALLHKDESTSLKYIKFVEKSPLKEEAANAFTRAFLGVTIDRKEAANA